MSNHGSFFKAARKAQSLSLREVEGETGISNAYLSQLETDKVRHPSPNVLFKLAELYGVPYEVLMEKVGYPIPKREQEKEEESTIFRRIGKINAEEEEVLLQYLAFIRKQNKK